MDVVIHFCRHCFQLFKGHYKLTLAFSNSAFCSRRLCNANTFPVICRTNSGHFQLLRCNGIWSDSRWQCFEEHITSIFRIQEEVEEAVSSELLVSIYKTTRCHIADGRYLNNLRRENFRSQRLSAPISLTA